MKHRWRQLGFGATLAIASGCTINGKNLLPGFGGKGASALRSPTAKPAAGAVATGAGSSEEAEDDGALCADLARAAPEDRLALKVLANRQLSPDGYTATECYQFLPDAAELTGAFDRPDVGPVGQAALLLSCNNVLGCLYSAAHFDPAALAAAAKDKRYTPRERELIISAGPKISAWLAEQAEWLPEGGTPRWNRKIFIDGRPRAIAAWDTAYQADRAALDFVFATYRAMAAKPTADLGCRDQAVDQLLARLGAVKAGPVTAVVPALDTPAVHGLMVMALHCAASADDAPLFTTLDVVRDILVDRLINTKLTFSDRWALRGPDGVAALAMKAAAEAAKADGKDVAGGVDIPEAPRLLDPIRLPRDKAVVGDPNHGRRYGTIAKLTDDGEHVIVTFKKRTKKEVAAVNCEDGRVTGIDANGNFEHESRCDFKEYTVDLTTVPTRIDRRFAGGLRKGDWVYFATIEPMDVIERESGTQYDGLPVIGFAGEDEKKVVSLLGARLR